MQQAEWVAKNFIANGRPRVQRGRHTSCLSKAGNRNVLDRLFYNKPERAMAMTLKGPAGNEQAYTDAFNEVFGA